MSSVDSVDCVAPAPVGGMGAAVVLGPFVASAPLRTVVSGVVDDGGGALVEATDCGAEVTGADVVGAAPDRTSLALAPQPASTAMNAAARATPSRAVIARRGGPPGGVSVLESESGAPVGATVNAFGAGKVGSMAQTIAANPERFVWQVLGTREVRDGPPRHDREIGSASAATASISTSWFG